MYALFARVCDERLATFKTTELPSITTQAQQIKQELSEVRTLINQLQETVNKDLKLQTQGLIAKAVSTGSLAGRSYQGNESSLIRGSGYAIVSASTSIDKVNSYVSTDEARQGNLYAKIDGMWEVRATQYETSMTVNVNKTVYTFTSNYKIPFSESIVLNVHEGAQNYSNGYTTATYTIYKYDI